MTFEAYNIDEHVNRYAVWAAARAASVSRFSNSEIDQFIRECKLKEEVQQICSRKRFTKEKYKLWFVRVVTALLNSMKKYKHPKAKTRKISFGIAAKVVSIYIKTAVVIPTNGESVIAMLAYPPIDSILLRAIQSTTEVKFKRFTWSEMKEKEYMETLDKVIVLSKNKPYWMLEYFWDIKKVTKNQRIKAV